MGKLPWFKFYPGDWMKDPELRSVSSGARGLWIDMLSLMFECDRRGYLQLNNGKIVDAEILARMTGNSTGDTSLWLQELESSGVFSRTENGTIYSRRQLRDEKQRSAVRERVTKHRCNATVTHDVTAVSDSDYESGVVVDVGSKSKPSFEEVFNYCMERQNNVDPQKWFDYYSSNGWKVGRNAMKDWRAAVRTWERNSHDKQQVTPVHHERTIRNREAILAGLGISPNVGTVNADNSPRSTPRRSPLLGGDVRERES